MGANHAGSCRFAFPTFEEPGGDRTSPPGGFGARRNLSTRTGGPRAICPQNIAYWVLTKMSEAGTICTLIKPRFRSLAKAPGHSIQSVWWPFSLNLRPKGIAFRIQNRTTSCSAFPRALHSCPYPVLKTPRHATCSIPRSHFLSSAKSHGYGI